VSSDRTQRDGQFENRIMDTAQFPTATFTLRSPVDLKTSPAVGDTVTASSTGNLTLHGVTKKVTFDVTAKRVTGSIRVNGTIPIHFSDYSIDNPSGGPASVGNDGTLEFTIVFSR
jgi:polyisoprenoid-binding protein YceI